MTDRYILDEYNIPIPCKDLMAWSRWFGKDKRIVARTEVGSVLVSTVFLGIDHRFGDEGPAILWESMAFDSGPNGVDFADLDQRRYTSRAAALKGHEEMVKKWTKAK